MRSTSRALGELEFVERGAILLPETADNHGVRWGPEGKTLLVRLTRAIGDRILVHEGGVAMLSTELIDATGERIWSPEVYSETASGKMKCTARGDVQA